MAHFHKKAKHLKVKTVLRPPDLEQSKRAVLEFARGGEFPGIVRTRD
jgi:hypothetical protein